MAAEAAAASGKRVLFLFSEAAGGHRARAEAMAEALELEFPGLFEAQLVDFYGEYCPASLRYFSRLYRAVLRWLRSFLWALDGAGRARAVSVVTYPYLRPAMHRMLADNPADLIVSVHPLVNQTLMRAMRKAPRPHLTVVADLASAHAFWFDRRTDLVAVASAEVAQIATRRRIPEGNIRLVGLPVGEAFGERPADPARGRARWGWATDGSVILLAAGTSGSGAVRRVAAAIDAAGLQATLVIVCGGNGALAAELSRRHWRTPTHVYGFVEDPAAFMAAADIFVTTAGATAFAEAFVSGLPLVVFGSAAGREGRNVAHVIGRGAGVWAPRPRAVVEVLRTWIADPQQRARVAMASAAAARPQAARQIARVIADQLGIRKTG